MANGQFAVADVVGQLGQGQQTALNQQAAQQQFAAGQLQQQQQQELAPLRLQSAQLGVQQQRQTLDAGHDEASIKRNIQTALELRSAPDSQKASILTRKIQEGVANGRDMTQSRQALEFINAGRFEELAQGGEKLIAVGEKLGLIKMDAAEKVAPFQFKEGGIIFNPNTGETKVDPVAKQRIDNRAQKANVKGKLDFKDKQSMNKDVTGLLKNTVGIFNTAKDLDKLGQLQGGPASIALVFKFMKALDPTSVVRESEFATAQNSAGVPEGIRNIFNKLNTGERLGEPQIKQFVEAAQTLANTAIDGSSVEINSLLDTFGDTLPDNFKKSLLNRVPKPFDAPQAPAATFNSTALGREVSEQDIADTLQANPDLTREQLLQQLGVQ